MTEKEMEAFFEVFEKYRIESIRDGLYQWFDIEGLYQAFKTRLLKEMKEANETPNT